jgi:hypothetical protein
LHVGDSTVDPDLLELEPHPALNPVVQVLDRKKIRRPPKNISSLFDIPAQYLVVYRNGATAWVRGSHLRSPEEKRMVKQFEFRFQRTNNLPCNQVKDYPVRLDEENPVSDDELEIGHYQDRYGSDSERSTG